MKRYLFLLIVTFALVWANAQTPSPNYWKLVVTDVVGNKDSIEVGYDSTATIGLDANETNYYGLPYSDLDFRSLVYDSTCFTLPFQVANNLELKRDLRPGFNGRRNSQFPSHHNALVIKFKALYFPLRVTLKSNYLLNLINAGNMQPISRHVQFSFYTFTNCAFAGGSTIDRFVVYYNTVNFQVNNPFGSAIYYLLFIDITGLLDNLSKELLRITATPQPNPTANWFTIPGVGREGVLSLVNASGRVVRQESFVPGSEVDISSLPKGLYLFRLVSEGAVTQGKVVRE